MCGGVGSIIAKGGSLRMPACSSCSSRPSAAWTRLPPDGVPVEVLADRLRQFLAAQGREGGDHLLDLGDLPTGEAPTEEGGRLELFDQGVHERIRTLASYHRKSGLGC